MYRLAGDDKKVHTLFKEFDSESFFCLQFFQFFNFVSSIAHCFGYTMQYTKITYNSLCSNFIFY